MNTKEILIEQLKACYNETSWFVTAETALDGLTDEQADWKAEISAILFGKKSII